MNSKLLRRQKWGIYTNNINNIIRNIFAFNWYKIETNMEWWGLDLLIISLVSNSGINVGITFK